MDDRCYENVWGMVHLYPISSTSANIRFGMSEIVEYL